MRRTTLAVALVVSSLLWFPRSGRAANACGVVPTVQPLRDEDKARKEVTYAGEVQSRGDRTARFTSARMQVVDRNGGKVFGEASEAIKPSTLTVDIERSD